MHSTPMFYIISSIILFISCTDKNVNQVKNEVDLTESKTVVPEFQSILDSDKVKGSILIYDLNTDTYFSNDFQWAEGGKLPASTFKIPNSIIALETGVVENDSTLFKWNGEQRLLKSWEQDLTFKEAFHYSCVPCYQDVARKVGTERMNEYLKELQYGSMVVDSNNIDMFWLRGESRITQFQQIDFLKRFYQSELPVSERTEAIMRKMIAIDANERYTISGKTGWSISDTINNGWFVGYVENKENTWFFATNIEPNQEFDMDRFPMVRKDVTFKALEEMDIINKEN